MKDPKHYIHLISSAVGDPDALSKVIKSIQLDAAVSAFQTTDEDFNMEAIQGNDNWHNDAIHEKLMS